MDICLKKLGTIKMPVNMAADLAVNISVEQLLEWEVEEIGRDGQEKYVPQLSMSEQLTKFAHKIDFLSDDKSQKSTKEPKANNEEKTLATFQPSLWPWDAVRTKLRSSLTEVCVLSDILNIVQEKKYMVLDPVTQNQAPPKPTVQMLAKRKNLASAAEIILQGTKRMETAIQERVNQKDQQGHQQEDFHSELIGLRQRWKLKRSGESIMGDLTFRSAGSKFWNPGLFEVTKATQHDDEEVSCQKSDSSLVEVKVGSDLEGVASVTVSICESGSTDSERKVAPKILAKVQDLSKAPTWQKSLHSAQQNIFCKELFTQLSQEAYHSRGPITNLVMGNEIRTEVFPGVDLCITYSHEKDTEDSTNDVTHNQPIAKSIGPLEYTLQALLRKRHQQNQQVVLPHPVTSRQIPGSNKRLRIAGSGALRATDIPPVERESMLDTIIKVSKHDILRRRVMEMIDNLASELRDPCIVCHWSTVASETSTSAVLHIHSPEINDVGKISFQVKVGIKDIQVVCTDGSTVILTSHVRDFNDFILTQVAHHRILVAHSIAVSLGWQVLHVKRQAPTGNTDEQGHVAGLVVTTLDGDKTIAVKAGPSSGATVSIKRSHRHTNSLPDFLTDSKWALIGGSFKQVDWEQVPGSTFVQKFFLLIGVETA